MNENTREKITKECGVSEDAFVKELDDNSNLFVDWRYVFEKEDIQVSWMFLQKFSIALKNSFEQNK